MADAAHPHLTHNSERLKFGTCVFAHLLSAAAVPKSAEEVVDLEKGIGFPVSLSVSTDSTGSKQPVTHVRLSLGSTAPSASHDEDEKKSGDSLSNIYFQHAPHCPVRDWTNSPQDKRPHLQHPNPLQISTCVLVEDEHGRLMLTRRASHLRSFPRAWVFPGGRVDPGEDLAAAGVREVKEEVNIDLDPESLQPLCIWESCFPTRVSIGPPKYHCLVMFYLATVKSSQCDNTRAQLSEVDKLAWFPKDDLLADVSVRIEDAHNYMLTDENGTKTDADAVVDLPVAEPSDQEQAMNSSNGARVTDLLSGASFPVSELIGIYPNKLGTGIGRAHHYALRVLKASAEQQAKSSL